MQPALARHTSVCCMRSAPPNPKPQTQSTCTDEWFTKCGPCMVQGLLRTLYSSRKSIEGTGHFDQPPDVGLSQNKGYPFRGSQNRDFSMLGSILLMEEILRHFNALLNFKTRTPFLTLVATVRTASWDK